MSIFFFFRRSREAHKKLEQHRLRLYRIAYSWTHNRALADDLVQETLIKAVLKADQLRDPDAGSAWLYTILANCYRDHFRRLRETESVEDLELVHESTPEQEMNQQQIVHKVRSAMARLPEGQRQVMTLVDLEGFSYVEVANILGVPIGTVMSRLCRARNALREQLLKQDAQQIADVVQGAKLRRVK